MKRSKIEMYKRLNKFAKVGGCVIFGGSDDVDIPIGELKQVFDPEENYYNRSVPKLDPNEAADIYRECVEELSPKLLFLHIGADEGENTSVSDKCFDEAYTTLIDAIRTNNKNCKIAVVSARNRENSEAVKDLNDRLKKIAESKKCMFCDISQKREVSIGQKGKIMSFVHDIGFVSPLRIERPVNDIAEMIFCGV